MRNVLGIALVLCMALSGMAQAATVQDTFTRADSANLGSTEVGGYAWVKLANDNVTASASISGGQLFFDGIYDIPGQPAIHNNQVGGAGLDGVQFGDFDASINMIQNVGNTPYIASGLFYRASAIGDFYQPGYHLYVENGAALYLADTTGVLAMTTAAQTGLINNFYSSVNPAGAVLKISVHGNTHTAYVNGTEVFSYTDTRSTAVNGPGYFTVSRTVGQTWFDNLEINAVPEPGSLAALASGLVGLVGMAIRRRK